VNENTSQSYSSSSVSSASNAHSHSMQMIMHGVWNSLWRVLIVAMGYGLASTIAGRLLGKNLEWDAAGISLLSGILIGATFGPIAARMAASRFSHWMVWASVLFLNALSVAIEGAFFAPTLSPMATTPIAWSAYLLFQSLVTAGLIAWLFGQIAGLTTPNPSRKRAWYSWAWRFVVSAFSYLVFYVIFGAVNYALVTKPYYAAHVSGLAVPPPQTVLMAEMVRAPLIVLSIVPLILLGKTRKPLLAVLCGIILFVIGGVIPLLLNPALPDLLRFASAIEIFFQNFLTGVVAVALLGFVAMKEPMDQ
jgi:hypothetical protein